jgi:hypothetical protein
MIRTRRRPAITQIEGLIIVAISGILIGFLLIGVMKVREGAARAHCQCNLKQVGLAAHNYASVNNYLPPGWLGPFPSTSIEATPETRMQAVGCLCLLLPFVEQQGLYAQFLACAPAKDYFDVKATYAAWYHLPPGPNGDSMLNLATTQIPTFCCPSDTPYQRANGCIFWQWGPIDRAINGVPQNFFIYTGDERGRLGRTSYVGVGGIDQNFYQKDQPDAASPPGSIWAKFDGIMANRTQLTLDDITAADGTSNTFMFAELLGDSDGPASHQIGYSVSWMCGSYPSYSGVPTGDLPYPAGSSKCYWAFGSRHADVIQVQMGDGAVRPVKKGVPPFDTNHYDEKLNPKCMFGYYSGWHDGYWLDPAFIGN